MAADSYTDGSTNPSPAYVDRRLIGTSAALMTAGLLACMAGATLGLAAVASACRRYLADLDEPPRAAARRRFSQARSATMAGVGAWQDYARQARSDAVH